MEWAIPQFFRDAFEKKGYVPSDHNMNQFIKECEIIERQQSKEVKKKETTPTLWTKVVGDGKATASTKGSWFATRAMGTATRNRSARRNLAARMYADTAPGSGTTRPTAHPSTTPKPDNSGEGGARQQGRNGQTGTWWKGPGGRLQPQRWRPRESQRSCCTNVAIQFNSWVSGRNG